MGLGLELRREVVRWELESVGVDKIIRIVLSTEGPVSPYIHEGLG